MNLVSRSNDASSMEMNAASLKASSEPVEDPLALYESETAAGPAGQLTRFAQLSQAPAASQQPPTAVEDRGPIPLDQVLNRLGHVGWPEAVAIIEALCGTLTGDIAGGNTPVPELPYISITAQGSVVVRGRAAAGEPGPRLARALHALTAAGTVPVPVRLFVTKWASMTSEHSISDFCKELAYFARPDGVALIKSVYDRAAAAPSVSPQPQPVVAQTAVPKNPPRDKRRSGRSRWIAAAVIVIAAALASLMIGLSTSSGQASTIAITGLLSKTTEAARRMTENWPSRAGLTASPSVGSSQPEVSPQASRPSSARRGTGAARGVAGLSAGVKPAARPADDAGTVAAAPMAGGLSSPDPGSSLVAPAVATADVQANPDGVRSGRDAESSQIYSSEDRDVTPPGIRHPQLPPPLFSGVQEDMNTIELIISETGTVERVRLLSPPKRMADMMLLSGAKTWSFEPASRQGQSVRYRLLLTWAATP
jgi:hypothetical protein